MGRQVCIILLLLAGVTQPAFGQYYFTGTTVSGDGTPIAFVKLFLGKQAMLHQSGSGGLFGIPWAQNTDSVVGVAPGYDTLRTVLRANGPNSLVFQPNLHHQNRLQLEHRLNSLTQNLLKDPDYERQVVIGESYTEMVENGFVDAGRFPKTGFSPNVNSAAYSNIRRFINSQSRVPSNAIRIEEMLNYFGLNCTTKPVGNDVFSVETRISDCPWQPGNLLLFVNAQAQKLNLDDVPPANLVFLIDNSGSMNEPNKLPLLKTGFKLLVNTLRSVDKVAIVTYGGSAGIALPPTSGLQKAKIDSAIESITPGGSTPGSNGIVLAYELATTNPIPNGNNRVILATDGDFNVGITNDESLVQLIESYKNTGVYLTCLGVGMGNYKDSKIEVLARHGNGNFAYLDTEAEAEKVLVKELTRSLYAVAVNVTVELTLDDKLTKRYRLMGYDNRLEALRVGANKLIGGEIGSGYALVSVLELEPVDSAAGWRMANENEQMGTVAVSYALPGAPADAQQALHSVPFNHASFATIDRRLQLAAAVAMWGNMLRHPERISEGDFTLLENIARQAVDPTNPQQAEFLKLVLQSKQLYQPVEKPNRKKWLKPKQVN
jgi:Ca-activated chloride channel family protein